MGPGEDFDAFYSRAFRRLVERLFLVTGNVAEAEDVAQEAFTRAALRWRHLRDYEDPERWVRRVAMNLALDGLRRARRRLDLLARLRPEQVVPAVSAERLALLEALRALPRRQRSAIVLHHLLGMPVAEVAAELKVPVGTVKSWLARGRRRLAGVLGDGERVGNGVRTNG